MPGSAAGSATIRARRRSTPPQVVGAGVYYLALLLVFIGVCEALNLTLITEPLRPLLRTVLAYVPRVLGAVVLLLVAWAIATIAR